MEHYIVYFVAVSVMKKKSITLTPGVAEDNLREEFILSAYFKLNE